MDRIDRILRASSNVLCATNRKCFPKCLRLGRYMLAINRQASSFCSLEEEGVCREFQQTRSNERRSRPLDIQVSRHSVRSFSVVFLRQKLLIPTNTTRTISQSICRIRFLRRIIFSNHANHFIAVSEDNVLDLTILYPKYIYVK